MAEKELTAARPHAGHQWDHAPAGAAASTVMSIHHLTTPFLLSVGQLRKLATPSNRSRLEPASNGSSLSYIFDSPKLLLQKTILNSWCCFSLLLIQTPVRSPQFFLTWVGILASDISSDRPLGLSHQGHVNREPSFLGHPQRVFPLSFYISIALFANKQKPHKNILPQNLWAHSHS